MRAADPRYGEIDWARGACRSMERDTFFEPALEAYAVSTCWTCEIRPECGHYAIMANEEYGVWGGLTADQRRNMRSRRVRVRCPGCGSTQVNKAQSRMEICESCGLSYPV